VAIATPYPSVAFDGGFLKFGITPGGGLAAGESRISSISLLAADWLSLLAILNIRDVGDSLECML